VRLDNTLSIPKVSKNEEDEENGNQRHGSKSWNECYFRDKRKAEETTFCLRSQDFRITLAEVTRKQKRLIRNFIVSHSNKVYFCQPKFLSGKSPRSYIHGASCPAFPDSAQVRPQQPHLLQTHHPIQNPSHRDQWYHLAFPNIDKQAFNFLRTKKKAQAEQPTALATSLPTTDVFGLFTLIEPDATPLLNIVFVHGLGGSAHNTWTDDQTKAFWPPWLAKVTGLENARIMTFGYDSNWKKIWKPNNVLDVPDFARQLVNELWLHYADHGDVCQI